MYARTIIAIALTSMLLLPLRTEAQLGGRSTYQFLNLPLSAQSTALGGKALTTDSPSLPTVLGNPSLLDSSMHNGIDASYINYISNLNYGSVIYARHFARLGTMAFGLQQLGYGKFERINEQGGHEGSFRCHETCLSGMYSMRLDTAVNIGLTLKLVSSQLESYWSGGIAIDLAAQYTSRDGSFTAAIALRNAGLMLKTYSGQHEQLPIELLVGLSKRLQHAPLRFVLTFQQVQNLSMRYRGQEAATISLMSGEVQQEGLLRRVGGEVLSHVVLGLEVTPVPALCIRLGYNHQRRNELAVAAKTSMVGLSGGFGISIKKYTFGYSCAMYHLAGFSHHFSVGTNINRFMNKH